MPMRTRLSTSATDVFGSAGIHNGVNKLGIIPLVHSAHQRVAEKMQQGRSSAQRLGKRSQNARRNDDWKIADRRQGTNRNNSALSKTDGADESRQMAMRFGRQIQFAFVRMWNTQRCLVVLGSSPKQERNTRRFLPDENRKLPLSNTGWCLLCTTHCWHLPPTCLFQSLRCFLNH